MRVSWPQIIQAMHSLPTPNPIWKLRLLSGHPTRHKVTGVASPHQPSPAPDNTECSRDALGGVKRECKIPTSQRLWGLEAHSPTRVRAGWGHRTQCRRSSRVPAIRRLESAFHLSTKVRMCLDQGPHLKPRHGHNSHPIRRGSEFWAGEGLSQHPHHARRGVWIGAEARRLEQTDKAEGWCVEYG